MQKTKIKSEVKWSQTSSYGFDSDRAICKLCQIFGITVNILTSRHFNYALCFLFNCLRTSFPRHNGSIPRCVRLRLAPRLGSRIIHVAGNEKWKWGNGNGRALRHKWGVVKQESRVYMLCTVAQVFSARGSRSIVLFTSPFSGEESSYILTNYVHTLQLFDLCH